MKVRTRFAPSPTGVLHIGGARTALFNYLYAKKYKGKFFLRIEDTDVSRSTEQLNMVIVESMNWLNLDFDEDIIYQSSRKERHLDVAHQLLNNKKAYYCFSSQDEIRSIREKARNTGGHFIFKSPWRDATSRDYPNNIKPVIRLKSPNNGETKIFDLLQGKISVKNIHLDDTILVRNDGTPTYMLSVVVDDHDMQITHIIRGNDHLSNAPKQKLLYSAMGWDIPCMIHIPLIHGHDGGKLSKRNGDLGIEEYKKIGCLPEALNNYLLRLGWSHGDDEIISRTEAIKWFDIKGLGKSPSKLDFNKIKNINGQYLRKCDNSILTKIIFEYYKEKLSNTSRQNITAAIDLIKRRSELLTDLYELAKIFIVDRPLYINDQAKQIISKCDKSVISQVKESIHLMKKLSTENIKIELKTIAKNNDLAIKDLMSYIRAYITGKADSPSIFEMILILGKQETISRLQMND